MKKQGGDFPYALLLHPVPELRNQLPALLSPLLRRAACQSIKRPVLPQTRHFRRQTLATASFREERIVRGKSSPCHALAGPGAKKSGMPARDRSFGVSERQMFLSQSA